MVFRTCRRRRRAPVHQQSERALQHFDGRQHHDDDGHAECRLLPHSRALRRQRPPDIAGRQRGARADVSAHRQQVDHRRVGGATVDGAHRQNSVSIFFIFVNLEITVIFQLALLKF